MGKVFSINDILKEINQALHGNDPEYYSIPQDRKTIAQEFLLFENSGSDDLERVVDSEFRKTRITIKTSWVDGVIFNEFIKDIKARFNDSLSAKADISITGTMSLMARALTAAMHSTAKSYVLAFLVISLMMIFLVGNIRIGILSMIPNIIPILLMLSVLKIAGMTIGITTLLAIGVCIGIVVDDTVHFIYGYRKYYDETGDAVESMRRTFLGTGRAMLITSIILVCAFSANLMCDMININKFGALIMLIIAFALIFDFILLPALLFMVSGKNSNHKKSWA